jgi:Dolichyl-phosphate-mannose-protein mannosyltransferase
LRVAPAVIWRRLTRLVAGNRLFAAVLVPALLLRVDAELGYRWQSWFNDSFTYAQAAATLKPELTRPSGYSVYLWLLSAPAHGYLLVTVSQHLMGLGVAVMIYALARHRFGARAWIAVLAALPVLYDGFEIQLEHLIMADTLFLFLAMAAVTVLLWSPRPSWQACLAAGLLLGLSATVRSTGLPLVAVFLLYLLVRLVRDWRKLLVSLAACGLAFAVPLAGYAGWFHSAYGEFALTNSTGVFLYSRVTTFADCADMSLTADLRPLCPAAPPDQRPLAQDYIWTPVSPLRHLGHPEFSSVVNERAKRFAVKAIEAQPLDYLRAAWDDTARSFDWNRSVFPDAATYDEYQFGDQVKGSPVTVTVSPFAPVIRDYQRYVWLPGTVFGLILLAGLVLGVIRRRLTQVLVPWLSSVALIVVPAATAEFDYRYVTTAVPFACLALAVALGSARLARDSTGGGPDRSLADTRHDERNLTADAA